MWATARYTFHLSEEEFGFMSPGMWSAMHKARFDELSILDMMQARLCSVMRATTPTKSKRKIKEEDFKFFKTNKPKPIDKVTEMKHKWMAYVAAHNASVKEAT